MYLQRLILLLVGGILFGVTINNVEAASGPVKRFSITKKVVEGVQSETKAQVYARSLTSRKPTRRSTALRRQVSNLPTVPATIGATDRFFGTDLGGLVYRPATSDWIISASQADGPRAILNVPEAGFSAASTSRVITQSGNSLAWQSCEDLTVAEAASFALGTGPLCLTDVAVPTGPGAPPGNIVTPGGVIRVYETDVWGNTAGVIQWTNPDLTRVSITLVRLGSTYHFPAGPQLLGLADVGAYIQYLTSRQIAAGFPLVDYPLNYEFIASAPVFLLFVSD
ncbi:hypothetical protein CVT25_006268 [Psilocybe cyanescens]|uniref:Peptidase A1 domain-containing protein n=1 Tax=Psilocybe cyanescens TaxID=93625 RepID=A0A409WYW0_PSICY|nr:hypothetical protein CVT25_006268 [Psilocybe cyanescens]